VFAPSIGLDQFDYCNSLQRRRQSMPIIYCLPVPALNYLARLYERRRVAAITAATCRNNRTVVSCAHTQFQSPVIGSHKIQTNTCTKSVIIINLLRS